MSEQQQAHQAMVEFVKLANQLKEQGSSVNAVTTGMMRACATYATYSVVGNRGGLNPSGIDKVADVFKKQLSIVADARRQENAAQQGKSE